jgi:integrase
LCLLPLRPGALADRTTGDFDKRTRTLTIGSDKAGHARMVTLPQTTADFLSKHIKGKQRGAPLFMRPNGAPWDRNSWRDAIDAAAEGAKLPAATCAYTIRHSTITDLVLAGVPLLTVAQISGTSVTMIERHYGHLVQERAAEALAGLAL